MKGCDGKDISPKIILGILLIILGIKAIVLPLVFAIALTLLLRIIFLIGGIVQLIYALHLRQSGRFWLKLAVSMFYILGGLFLLLNPTTGTVALASAVGILFTGVGIFESLQALQTRRQGKLDWLSLWVGIVNKECLRLLTTTSIARNCSVSV